MKNILNALLVGVISMGYVSLTQANEYPASDFQPKVLYKDESYKPSSSSSSSTDSKYPATNFQPKVVYKDPNYKPSKSKKSSGKIKSNTSYSTSSSNKAEPAEVYAKAEKKEDSDMTLVIGLVVLVLVGLFYVKNKSAPAEKKGARRKPSYKKVVASAGEGQSRVAKYLAEKQGGATGVAKYLASKKETASSSVAKYLAKRKVAERQSAAAKVSGVEKYLRDRT